MIRGNANFTIPDTVSSNKIWNELKVSAWKESNLGLLSQIQFSYGRKEKNYLKASKIKKILLDLYGTKFFSSPHFT